MRMRLSDTSRFHIPPFGPKRISRNTGTQFSPKGWGTQHYFEGQKTPLEAWATRHRVMHSTGTSSRLFFPHALIVPLVTFSFASDVIRIAPDSFFHLNRSREWLLAVSPGQLSRALGEAVGSE